MGHRNGGSMKEKKDTEEKKLSEIDLDEMTNVSSGFIDIDLYTKGFRPSSLNIVGARPSMGKSCFLLNIASNFSIKGTGSILYFSLEMTAEEIFKKIICINAEVTIEDIERGASFVEKKVSEIQKSLDESNFIIYDSPGIRIDDLCEKARKASKKDPVDLMFVDYIQLISSGSVSTTFEARHLELLDISRKLKWLARELRIPIICASQLSRKVEERVGHRPILSDLRESGSLEEDADLVMFLFRRDYYNPNDKPGRAEIILAKNRYGETGNIELTFRKKFCQFYDYNREQDQQQVKDTPAPFSAFSQFSTAH